MDAKKGPNRARKDDAGELIRCRTWTTRIAKLRFENRKAPGLLPRQLGDKVIRLEVGHFNAN